MNKLFIFIALAFVFTSVKAHNPNTASVVLSPINGIWVAQFTISQEGASYALQAFYTEKDLQEISVEEYKKLYIDYIKNNISLFVDGKVIGLSSGGIKLGNHQTNMNFLLPEFPKEFRNVTLNLSIFKENKGQNTVVKFVENGKFFRKVLNHKNQFYLEFQNTKSSFIEGNEIAGGYIKYFYISFGLLFFLGLGTYLKKAN